MRYWIFQAVPERYKLSEAMPRRDREDWHVTRYAADIKPGDVVYYWQAGKEAALHGWGKVASEPFVDDRGDLRMETTYEGRFDEPLPKSTLQEVEELKDLQLFRAPQGTNFKVSTDESKAINEIARSAGFEPPPDPADEPSGGAS